MPRKLSLDQRELLLEQYKKGVKIRFLMVDFDVSQSTLNRYVEDAGLPFRKARGKKSFYRQTTIHLGLKEEAYRGLEEEAKEYGVPKAQVVRWAVEAWLARGHCAGQRQEGRRGELGQDSQGAKPTHAPPQ